MPKRIINGKDIEIESIIVNIINKIHSDGPIDPKSFEQLAYLKKYQNDIFSRYEKKILFLLGLFYKVDTPENILDEVYSIYADAIKEETGKSFTPVQAHAYKSIKDKKYFSFSAPTSAGKSFLFRELISDCTGDIVIVVPSRALIAEYVSSVNELVDNSVLVLPFIDNINISKTKRRIFIITPERGVDLFKQIKNFNIELFLLDEAQISEEEIRGMKFDAFVRRIDRHLPDAKKVFAHPFINNPEAQLLKHNFSVDSSSYMYNQHTVGKIFLSIKDGLFTNFTPYEEEPKQRILSTDLDVVEEVLKSGGTLLVFTSKKKIYNGKYIVDFAKYINMFSKIKDAHALKVINELREFIGAEVHGSDKFSHMIDMMERGIVIHHGSMPLKARLIVEEFIRSDFAHICFATSTLNQGINMPFNIVWIDNFSRVDPLTLKNLIGRSGRTTISKNKFEFGYTIVKEKNVKTFSDRIKQPISLNESSLIDQDISNIPDDFKDIAEAIKEDTFNDELHLTDSQVNRLKSQNINSNIKYILDNILKDGKPITGKDYYELNKSRRDNVKRSFKNIYIEHLRKNILSTQEASVLSASIPIMLWHIQGKSFSEIVSLRHAFLGDKDQQRNIIKRVKSKEITETQGKELFDNILIKYSPIPATLPNSKLSRASLFPEDTSISYMDYDTLVYDTYDYLDKVVSLSLSDPFAAAFQIYYDNSMDPRALIMKNYIRYGTNDNMEIWLLRYGFGFEEAEWIKEYIESIDENEIVFKRTINGLSVEKLEMIKRFK